MANNLIAMPIYNKGFALPDHIDLAHIVSYAQSNFVLTVPLSTTSTSATSAFTAYVPQGAIVTLLTVFTSVAFTASSGVTISIGSAAGGAQYVAATTITSLGTYQLTLVTTGLANLVNMPAGSPNMFITLTQSGSNTAVGTAVLVAQCTLP